MNPFLGLNLSQTPNPFFKAERMVDTSPSAISIYPIFKSNDRAHSPSSKRTALETRRRYTWLANSANSFISQNLAFLFLKVGHIKLFYLAYCKCLEFLS